MRQTVHGDRDEAIEALLRNGVEDGLFPGAIAAIGGTGIEPVRATVGQRDPTEEQPVTRETRFDLASLTKPIVTTTLVFQCLESGALTFDDTLEEHLPELAGTDRGEIPIHTLLTHTSGLQPYAYSADWDGTEDAMADLFERDLLSRPIGKSFEYSCLNFVHLREIVTRLADEPIATLVRRRLFDPVGMDGASVGGVDPSAVPVAVTYDHERTDQRLVGTTHDPIARAMDGFGGNAGLFATVDDVSRFAETILAGGLAPGSEERMLAPASIQSFPRERARGEDVAQGFGWRTPIDRTPAPNWSDRAIGHTGFTGTSLWIDLDRDLYAVLLTNAVYEGDTDISRFRKRFHALAATLATSGRDDR